MEYLNTEGSPRAVLDVEAAEAWIFELEELDRCWDQLDTTTRRGTPRISENWNPIGDIGSSSNPDPLPVIALLVEASQEKGILTVAGRHPIEFVPIGASEYLWRIRTTRWSSFTATEIKDARSLGVTGATSRYGKISIHILTECVQEANRMLTNNLHSAYTVMAEQSTDPVLLTRLATYDDPNVRDAVMYNPEAPPEAKAIAALLQ